MFSRRYWLRVAMVGASVFVVTPAAADPGLEVAAANNAVGAIVAAEVGDGVQVVVDPQLGPTQIRVAGEVVDVAGTILRKGRFLDDPRNAAKLGAGIRKALSAAYPERRAEFEANHRAWTHPFARRILTWNAALARSSVRGQRVANVHGRAALLEWAGAVLDATAAATGPAALATAPRGPAAPTLASYIEYIEALVAALA